MAQLNAADLEQFAKDAVTYEVTTMLGEVGHPNLHGSDPVLQVALIEAVLVHVRLLDEFHGQTGANAHPNDVLASHFLPTWTPTRTLSPPDRDAINAQLAHMSTQRTSGYSWDLATLVTDACRMFVSFVDAVRVANPGRAAWFDPAYQAASAMVAKYTSRVQTMPPALSLPKSTTSPTTAVIVTHAQPSRKTKYDAATARGPAGGRDPGRL
jgi:hypothetical protein